MRSLRSAVQQSYLLYWSRREQYPKCLIFCLNHHLRSTSCALKFPSSNLQGSIFQDGQHVEGINCLSWRLGVENNNVVKWATIPKQCAGYVGHYMLGQQYRDDSIVVTGAAISYVESLELAGDGKDMWVFDLDETTLSNLPYFAVHRFGSEPYNPTSFNHWFLQGKAPTLPASLKLYCKLLSLGVKVAFLTGRTEDQRSATATNLKHVGYYTWDKLILKGSSYSGKTSAFYKSSERGKLEEEGYRIIRNIGDQWSDLLGLTLAIALSICLILCTTSVDCFNYLCLTDY